MGHTIRSCLIGMRIAEQLDLPASDRSALYYALLLKDAGCSSNAARMSSLFGRLDTPARILAVADMYEALTSDRPYRSGMSRVRAQGILDADRGRRLSGYAIDALAAHTAEG